MEGSQRKFNVGDRVVHISHGVGKIVALEKREFAEGRAQEFYILEINDGGALKKVFVPADTAAQRLRLPYTGAKREEIIKALQADDTVTGLIEHSTWNRRYREYMELVHTGTLEDLVKVIKSLRNLEKEKDLSFGERKLLEVCKLKLEEELEIKI